MGGATATGGAELGHPHLTAPSQRPPGRPPTGPAAPGSSARLSRHSPLGPGAPPRSWPARCRPARPECAAQAPDLRSPLPPPRGPRPKLRPWCPRTEAAAACPPERPQRPPSPGPAGPALPPASSHYLRRRAPDPPARPPSAPPAAAAPPYPPPTATTNHRRRAAPPVAGSGAAAGARHSAPRAPERGGSSGPLAALRPNLPGGCSAPCGREGNCRFCLVGGGVSGFFRPPWHHPWLHRVLLQGVTY